MADDLLSLDDVADAVTSGNLDADQAQTATLPTPSIPPTPTPSPSSNNVATGVLDGQKQSETAVKAVETANVKKKLPDGFTPSEPLSNPKYEKAVRLYRVTRNQAEAYKRSGLMRLTSNPANVSCGASKLFNRPEVLARLEYLDNLDRKSVDSPDGTRKRKNREEILDDLEQIAAVSTPSDKLKALERYCELMGITKPPAQDDTRADPGKVTPVAVESCAALRDQCRAQGMAYAIVIDTDGELREAMAPTLKEVLEQVTPAQGGAS